MQKGFAPVIIILGIILILGIAGGVYYFGISKNGSILVTPKSCTQEAKICPDGSSVGRTGPNCEFSPCPTVKPIPSITIVSQSTSSAETVNWKTYTNEKYKFAFNYPSNWKVNEDLQSSFVQLQEIKEGKILSIIGGVTVVDKAISTYPTYVKMFTSNTKCPKEAGSIDLPDATNVYCFTGKELKINVNTWKGIVECSSSYLYGEKGDPETCPHQFWTQTKDFFYILHLNYFGPIIKGSKEEILFDQILSTFKFLDQKQVTTNSKSCQQNSDCALLMCSGCFNKEWAKTAPPDLPCAQYYGYRCECQDNTCTEVK